jgi:hypothetical protein
LLPFLSAGRIMFIIKTAVVVITHVREMPSFYLMRVTNYIGNIVFQIKSKSFPLTLNGEF